MIYNTNNIISIFDYPPLSTLLSTDAVYYYYYYYYYYYILTSKKEYI